MPTWIEHLEGAYVDNCARRAWLADEIVAVHERFDRAAAHVESVEEWTNVEHNRERKISAMQAEIEILAAAALKLQSQMEVAS